MENEYQKSIAQWRKGEHSFRLWVARLVAKVTQRRQVQSREQELFRDQFEFETGLDSHGKGKEAFESACRAHIQRAAEHKARRLANEERAGTIADFDDEGPMGDLGGDADFEAEILKQHPELKEYRK
jgi:hypothetical protein